MIGRTAEAAKVVDFPFFWVMFTIGESSGRSDGAVLAEITINTPEFSCAQMIVVARNQHGDRMANNMNSVK